MSNTPYDILQGKEGEIPLQTNGVKVEFSAYLDALTDCSRVETILPPACIEIIKGEIATCLPIARNLCTSIGTEIESARRSFQEDRIPFEDVIHAHAIYHRFVRLGQNPSPLLLPWSAMQECITECALGDLISGSDPKNWHAIKEALHVDSLESIISASSSSSIIWVRSCWDRPFGSSSKDYLEATAMEKLAKEFPDKRCIILVDGYVSKDFMRWAGGVGLSQEGEVPHVFLTYALRTDNNWCFPIALLVPKHLEPMTDARRLRLRNEREILRGLRPARMLGEEPFLVSAGQPHHVGSVEERLHAINQSLKSSRDRYFSLQSERLKGTEHVTKEEISQAVNRVLREMLSAGLIRDPQRMHAISEKNILQDVQKRIAGIKKTGPNITQNTRERRARRRKERYYSKNLPADGIPLSLEHVVLDSLRTFLTNKPRHYDVPNRFIGHPLQLETVIDSVKDTRIIRVQIADPVKPHSLEMVTIEREGEAAQYQKRMKDIQRLLAKENHKRMVEMLGGLEALDTMKEDFSRRPAGANPFTGLALSVPQESYSWYAEIETRSICAQHTELAARHAERMEKLFEIRDARKNTLMEQGVSGKALAKILADEFDSRMGEAKVHFLETEADMFAQIVYRQSEHYDPNSRERQPHLPLLKRVVSVVDTEQFKTIYVVDDRDRLIMAWEALHPDLSTSPDRPSHSELAGGRRVYGAGEVLFERYFYAFSTLSEWFGSLYTDPRDESWKIVEINNASGHYRPPAETLEYVMYILRDYMHLYQDAARQQGRFIRYYLPPSGIRRTDSLTRGRLADRPVY